MNADATIVVIGGSSGIGLAVARRSLADGATVVIAGRSQQRLDAARAELARAELARAEPAPGGALAATVNGALESMVLALALELAPIRVNAVSPGWVDTPVWDQLATPDVKNARMADLAARLPARRLGRPGDIANAVAFLIADDFVTGTVLHAEGAQILV